MRTRDATLALLPVLPFLIGLASAPAAADATVRCSVSDPAITESSGLVALGDRLVTTNDSGDTGRLFVLDATTCETLGVTSWQGSAVDVEALAPAGDDAVWVGDIGDNLARRDTVTISRVQVGTGDRTTEPTSYTFRYADRSGHNAETLLAQPQTGRLYVVSKDVLGGRVYAAPARLDPDGVNVLKPVGEPVLGIATDGAFLPDGRHLVLRNYRLAAVYTWPGLERIAQFELPKQQQGETLAALPQGGLLVGSEGADQPLLEQTLPAGIQAQASTDSSPTASATPEPAAEQADESDEGDEGAPWPWLVAGAGAALAAAGAAVLWRRRRR